MKQHTKCPHCGLTYDRALTRICPYCGKTPQPADCPEPLCILDMSDPSVCQNCPRKPGKHQGWGGKREGAGAPKGNLNRLTTGGYSQLLKRGIEKMANDPELRAVLYIIAHLANTDELPRSTRVLIRKITHPYFRTKDYIRKAGKEKKHA